MSGQRTGLQYPSLDAVLRLRNVKKKKRPDYLHKVQIIERAALDAWAEQSKEK